MSDVIDTVVDAASARHRHPPAVPPAVPWLTVIEPATGWRLVNIRELWQFRELIYFLAWRDVKVRYKQTLLGAAWAVLQPLAMMVIFTIFLGRVAPAQDAAVPYPLFVFTGLLSWTLFAAAITGAGNSVVGSERLITKIYFPRLAMPFAAIGAPLIDFAIAFAMLIGLMLWFGVWPAPGMMLVPAVLVLTLVAGIGVGTLLAALNVAFRDVKHVIPFLMQLWLFATPTIYMQPDPATFAGWRMLLLANPMIGLVSAFRGLSLGMPIDWQQAGVSAAIALLLFTAGCFYFRRVEDTFADVI